MYIHILKSCFFVLFFFPQTILNPSSTSTRSRTSRLQRSTGISTRSTPVKPTRVRVQPGYLNRMEEEILCWHFSVHSVHSHVWGHFYVSRLLAESWRQISSVYFPSEEKEMWSDKRRTKRRKSLFNSDLIHYTLCNRVTVSRYQTWVCCDCDLCI